ncbi:MAG: hypothetical protein JOY72_03555 [Actinobacteria bacterium]|nr:hypothetical protein [Actinomycetota bacterium]MBV8479357.1 hypothetical protein [Actinomycetota bacterium]
MPTRKQKRREAKSKRHDYEYVYVDDDGNEVDAPPEAETRANGSKPASSKAAAPARGGRRQPQPPSWQRAGRRAVLLGIVVFIIFGTLNKSHNYGGAAIVAVIYTALFVPFTYALDRFAYRRFQQRQDAAAKKR